MVRRELILFFALILLIGNVSAIGIGGGLGIQLEDKSSDSSDSDSGDDGSENVEDDGNNVPDNSDNSVLENSGKGDNSATTSDNTKKDNRRDGPSSTLTIDNSNLNEDEGENVLESSHVISNSAIVLNSSTLRSNVVSVGSGNLLLGLLLFNTLILVVSMFLLLKFDKLLIQK